MKNRLRVLTILWLSALVLTVPAAVRASGFVDYSPARRLVEVDVHAMGGAGAVSQNYRNCFPQIQNLNVNMGVMMGVGARAVFGLREYLGFGTAIDLSINNYNMDLTVLGSDNMSMSAVFLDNHIYKVNIPLFVSFRFKVDRSVRWNVDAGLYYSYGLGGTQKQRIYRAEINEMDELVPQVSRVKTDYYHSGSTFINAFNRGDIGMHLATSLNFGPHLYVGVQFQYGFKNSSRSLGIINPRIHNYDLHGVVGYRF